MMQFNQTTTSITFLWEAVVSILGIILCRINAKVTDSDKSDGTKGALVPMHKFSSLFDYKISDKINNQLEYIYQERAYDTSSNELPSFSLVNYNFNYKIDSNFTSNFKISNILDQDYEVNRNYNTPGISFFGGVESEF